MQTVFFAVSFLTLAYLLANAFSAREGYTLAQIALYAVVSAFLASVALVLGLALIGIYRLWLLCALLAVLAVGVFCYCKKKGLLRAPRFFWGLAKCKKAHLLYFALFALCCVLFLAFPTYNWHGGRDNGLYVVNAAHVADTGSIAYAHDTLRAAVYDAIGGNLLEYPGIYDTFQWGISGTPGTQMPQFMPLYFCAGALAYGLGGFAALFRVNGIITLLSMGMAYYFCKQALSRATAVVAVFMLALNPAQLWNGRIPESEMLSQLLLFFALALFYEAWQHPSPKWALAAGLAMGLNLFCRIDSFIYGMSIYALWLYVAVFAPEKERICRWMAAAYTVFALGALGYLYGFSRPYLEQHWKPNLLMGLCILNLVFLLAAVLVNVSVSRLRPRLGPKANNENKFFKLLDMRFFLPITGLVFFAVFLYAYFLRPILGMDPETQAVGFGARAMVEFCWYTSVLAVPLAIFGMCRALKKDNSRRESLFFFLLLGLPSVIGYIYQPSIYPDHFWASRRWVTICIPFVVILCAYGCVALWRMRGTKERPRWLAWLCRGAAAAAGVLVTAYCCYQCSLFLFTSVGSGSFEALAAAAETLDDDAVYLTTDQRLASPLRYIFHKPVFYVDEFDAAFPAQIAGRNTYCLGAASSFTNSFLQEARVSSQTMIRTTYPEWAQGRYPDKMEESLYELSVFHVYPRKELSFTWGPDELRDVGFATAMPVEAGEVWVSDGSFGALLCGPYQELNPGDYTCSVTLRLLEEASGEIGFIDVAYGEDASQVEQLPLIAEDFSQGEPSTFYLGFRAKANETYEFRVFVYEDVVLELEEVSLASGAPPANTLQALAAPAEWSPDELRGAGFGTMMKFAQGEPWASDGRAGMLLNGPYKQLQPGGYALDVGLRLEQAGAGDIGFVDVACGEDRQQIAVLPLTEDLFGEDGTAQLRLPFDAEGDGRYEFRVIVNQGAVLELTSVGLANREPDTAQTRPAA